MSPLTTKRIAPLFHGLPAAVGLALWLCAGLAPAAAAVIGAGLIDQEAGLASIPVQAATSDYPDDPYAGRRPSQEQQEPSKPKRTSPWFQIQLPPITLPENEPQEPDLVEVPDLLGLAPAEAAGLLEERRLVMQQGRLLDGNAGSSERVVAQDPTAGARVEPGSPVTVDVELPPPLFPVPAIVGLTVQDAVATVTAAGFSFESKGAAQVDAARDRIVAQSPAAETLRPPGTTVVGELEPAPLRVVAPPPLPERSPRVVVPELSGLGRDAAAERLEAARLRLAEPPAEEARDPAAVVAGQSPAAGTEVPPRTAVAVVLRVPPPLETGAGEPALPERVPEVPPETQSAPPPEDQAPPDQPDEPAATDASEPSQTAFNRQQPTQPTSDAVIVLTVRDLWWAGGGAGLMLLLIAGWRLARSRTNAPAKPPVVSYKVERDPGEQQIQWDSEPGLRCRLHLRTVADAGTQEFMVEQDLEPRPVRRYG